MELNQESITFGKYKGFTLQKVLRDRNYCKWLLEQDWFQESYPYIFNRVNEYKPSSFFLLEVNTIDSNNFMDNYPYFNLVPVDRVSIDLNNVDKLCYEFYVKTLEEIKNKIYYRLENEEENPYDIKAPTCWLKLFEREYKIPRSEFKEFLLAYELPNIPYIIEKIKAEGGIMYKGAQSFLIGKNRSLEQEEYWLGILRGVYGENIGSQFTYENCIFDFINITTKTIFECKLGFKDFNENQHFKYKIALIKYRIVYLIAKDCVVHMEAKKLYTTNVKKYQNYLSRIKNPTYLDELIIDFEILEVNDISQVFGGYK